MVNPRPEYHKQYYLKNKKQKIESATVWNKNNPEKRKTILLNYYLNHQESEYQRIREWKKQNPDKCKEYWRRARRNSQPNPIPLEIQEAMDRVRIRDDNTCQWANCGLTIKEAPIHVHHIFPRSEYPELATVERFMICYCANHHGLFHRYRGDNYANFIISKGVNRNY